MISQGSRAIVWAPRSHLPELDGLRGVAILLVTVYRFAREIPFNEAFPAWIPMLVRLGDRGVDLFFVLSGFLITGILAESKNTSGYFSNFYMRRTLRIFPLYYASLLLFLIIVPFFFATTVFDSAIDRQPYLWTYLTNVHMAWSDLWCFGYMDHFWSLAVEEHFYLLWPLAIFLLSTRHAIYLSLGLAAASMIARTLCVGVLDCRVAADVLTIFRLEGLCLGSAVALAFRCETTWRVPRGFVAAAVCLVGGMAATLSMSERSLLTLGHTLWSLTWTGCLLLLLTGARGGLGARCLSLRPLRHFGKISYGMYVFQYPLVGILSGWMTATLLADALGSVVLGGCLYNAAMFLATWLAALASWYLFERHFIRMKDWFQPKRSAISTTPKLRQEVGKYAYSNHP